MNQNPRVVVAHLYNNYTGSPLVLAQAIKALRETGREVDLYTSKGPGFLDDVEVDNHYHNWYNWHPNKYRRLINFTISQLLLFFKLLKYRKQPVTIYANTILPFGAGLAGLVMGKRVIYHIHETEFQPKIFTRFLLKVIKWTASKLIFVSEYLRDYHDFPDIEQEVVYNALSEEFVQKAREFSQRQRRNKDFEVLMVCSLKKAKGIFEYLGLARILPHIKFTLIISQTQEQIDKFLSGASIPANLTLLPLQKDVHPFYARASLLLSLSHPIEWPETFGMSIVEGLTYGIPAIVPPVGAPVEIITNDKDGYTMDVREPEKIASKIDELYENPEKMAVLSHQARYTADRFSMEKFARQLKAVLD